VIGRNRGAGSYPIANEQVFENEITAVTMKRTTAKMKVLRFSETSINLCRTMHHYILQSGLQVAEISLENSRSQGS
jgi:hypothetical protein